MSDVSDKANRPERKIEGHAIDPCNQARIYAGETFRSRKPSTWRVGKSPSSYGSRGNRHK